MFTERHSVPIATVRGNHDKNEHFFGHYGLPNADGGNFAFLHKGVLFVAIDTNNTNCQFHIDYITKALAEHEYTWSILLMHHSLYSASKSGVSDNVNTLREGLTDFIVNHDGYLYGFWQDTNIISAEKLILVNCSLQHLPAQVQITMCRIILLPNGMRLS
jgi:hypothetical protein